MGNITDVQIRHWVKEAKPLAKSDGDGLTFTLSSKGVAAWILRYRFGGKAKELTLGRYPDFSLSEARKLATEKRALIQQGTDVAREKRRERLEAAAAQSFRELTEDYMEKVFPTLAASTVDQRRRYIKKIILPKIGSIPARELTPADIVDLVKQVWKQRSVNVAEVVLTAISEICKHGIGQIILSRNPCSDISLTAICGLPEPTRKRLKLTEEELKIILPALPSIGKENELATKILLATCVRICELARAEWINIDFHKQEWFVPDENSKTKKGFIVPLVPAVIGWLKELKELAGNSYYVLPARQSRRINNHGGDTFFNQRALNAMLHKMHIRMEKKFRRFTPHDLRSTARSYLSALGVNVIVAERCLNHTLGGLIAVYDQHDYLDERRAALEKWTGFILSCQAKVKSAEAF